MSADDAVPAALHAIPLDAIMRIDAALEGDWSATVVPLWTRAGGFLGFDGVVRRHPDRRPALELYCPGYWVGIHCCREEAGAFVLDEARARAVVAYVEARRAKAGRSR